VARVFVLEGNHTGEKLYGCLVCRRKFYDLGNLKKHLSRHGLDEFKYECDRPNCGSRYISDEGLQKHIIEHDTGKAPTSYSCKHCGATFDLEVEFFKHLARNHDEYPLEADYIIEGKQEEDILLHQLMQANVKFEREYNVNVRYLAGEGHGRRYLRLDFFLENLGDRIIILERGEHQHRGYDIKLESLRPLQIMKAFSLRGDDKPIVYINYNPHAFSIGPQRYDPPRHLRFQLQSMSIALRT